MPEVIQRSWAVAIASAALAGTAPPAVAASIERVGLQPSCAARSGENPAAFVCDPEGPGRRVSLSLGLDRIAVYKDDGDPRRDTRFPGVSQSIGGVEPLLAGDTVVLDWLAPSPRAELAIRRFTPVGVRSTVIRLSWRPEHVEVTNRADGSLEIRSPGRTDVVPAPLPFPRDHSLWAARTAGEASDRVLWAVDHLVDPALHETALRTLCAGLHPAVYARYGEARQLRGVVDDEGRSPCTRLLAAQGLGIDVESAPEIRSSRYVGRALDVRRRRAVLGTTVVNRLRRRDGRVVRDVVRARLLLVRDAAGIWRLGTVDAVLPFKNYKTDRRYDASALERSYRAARRKAASAQARFDEEEAARTAATVIAARTLPCSPVGQADDVGDVEVARSSDLARRPQEHSDIDLVHGGAIGRCLHLRTSGALPNRFTIMLGTGTEFRDIEVDRARRTVLVTSRTPEVFNPDVRLVHGIRAGLTDRELVVRFSKPLARGGGPPYLELSTLRSGIEYTDAIGGR